MSDFFDSEIIQEELTEINNLAELLTGDGIKENKPEVHWTTAQE